MDEETNTSEIKNWRSIITLVLFVVTNIIVIAPFHVPIYIPTVLWNVLLDLLHILRIIPQRDHSRKHQTKFRELLIPLNFITAPLIADLFLLAILAIGREEVHDGTLGKDNISPIDIMAFFITLAYIAISIDASGLIRYLAFKVLQKGGKVGHKLYLYLYTFFFALGSFIGNDPIILSGTAFLAYMTRVSSNIVHPRAWIFTQFAVANIASAILVSSNPTNLVLAGAFEIKFIHYTANMVVPVVVTAIILPFFLLYVVFSSEALIPVSITMHELSEEAKLRKAVNPNIPFARGTAEEQERKAANDAQTQELSLEEIMNPFVDRKGAAFGAVIMTAVLVTVLALNAASQAGHDRPVFWVTLPGAFVMFCWDVTSGWFNRKETRDIAARGRKEVERARIEEAIRNEDNAQRQAAIEKEAAEQDSNGRLSTQNGDIKSRDNLSIAKGNDIGLREVDEKSRNSTDALDLEKRITRQLEILHEKQRNRPVTLVSLSEDGYRWLQETFPTVTAVVVHLPFALIPFAFCMFVLVQALVTKGWVPLFARGWDHWVNKTGTVGAVGGMGFLSVVLCNFAGTNIGTTILLSRVIQSWQAIHRGNGIPITERTFWATVYAMALGVNYGAFSTCFSASLAGLLWRDILARKHIRIRSLDFARVNLPIITIAMCVGCAVLIGEVYLVRGKQPYDQ